jgi:hypothetical protein
MQKVCEKDGHLEKKNPQIKMVTGPTKAPNGPIIRKKRVCIIIII